MSRNKKDEKPLVYAEDKNTSAFTAKSVRKVPITEVMATPEIKHKQSVIST